MPAQTAAYQFGRFHLLADPRVLLVDGEPAKLGGRAFDLLLALVERRDRTVPREELFELVWPGRIVEDQNLKTQVLALRKVIGQQAIGTVPGRGYRFALPLDDGESPAAPTAPAPPLAPPTAPSPLTNLPAGQSPLHGRLDDIVAVVRLLSEHRLVTVAGAAGIGKTRLAQAAAAQLRPRFSDGAWMVELAPVADGALIASTVAKLLGFAVGKDIATVDGLARALSSLSLLLVLDNCEHLIAAASGFAAALLKSAPRVTILATSQEPLHLHDEQVFRLGTLALAPRDASAQQASSYGAVSMFVDRAQSADPRFRLSPANAAAVIEICRRLDGIPLAIELAASRMPVMGVAGIRERLDERFRLLTVGARGAPTRQQTLLDALEWSHGLLSEGAQAVFRRLGVFAGTFSLRSAQEVAADGRLDDWAVLDELGELVDKSLVLAEGSYEPRYRLLESTRAYAQRALARAGEDVAVRRRHAQAMAALFDRAEELFMQVPTMQWLSLLAPDLDNWREALAFSHGEAGDPATAVALVVSATVFLVSEGLGAEALQACERVAPLLEQHASPHGRARYWLAIAYLQSPWVPLAQALEAAKKAADGFRQAGDRLRLYRSLHLLSQHADLLGQVDAIVPADEELLRIESPDWPALLTRLRRQGIARKHRREGRLAEYRDGFAAEARLCALAGDDRAAWMLQNHVVLAEIALGHLDHAVEVARAVVEAIRERGMQREFWSQLALYARVMVEKGDPVAALPAVREAIGVLRTQGTLWWLGDYLAWLPGQRGDWVTAARLHGWVDGCAAKHSAPRGPVIQAARDRLRSRLQVELDAADLARLTDEGVALDDAEVIALALGEPA
jgi:predicted ATPase/DNA-binding winged helix-turn-helix (wHTH) protein